MPVRVSPTILISYIGRYIRHVCHCMPYGGQLRGFLPLATRRSGLVSEQAWTAAIAPVRKFVGHQRDPECLRIGSRCHGALRGPETTSGVCTVHADMQGCMHRAPPHLI